MARRNLRKWAEAKQQRAEQQVPPRGRWSYYGAPIFIEDAPLGTVVAPTAWLPMAEQPLFPDSVGKLLHATLHSEPTPGPPYTHLFNLPPTEYDEDGKPLPPPTEPTMTVVRHVQDDVLAEAYNAAGQWLYGTDMHPLLRDHGIDRCFTWGPSTLRNGVRRGPPAAYRRGAAPGA